MQKKVLLLSCGEYPNTSDPELKTPYLSYAEEIIANHFGAHSGKKKKILFIPYAKEEGGRDGFEEMARKAFERMGIEIVSAHRHENPVELLDQVDGVFIGGGSTQTLLKELQRTGLDVAIREKVENGMPYSGESAGANVAGQNIRVTNDMPIVESLDFNRFVKPLKEFFESVKDINSFTNFIDNAKNIFTKVSNLKEPLNYLFSVVSEDKTPLDAMGLTNFLINPHHMPETLGRKKNDETFEEFRPGQKGRIARYFKERENVIPVVGIPEGSGLLINGKNVKIVGPNKGPIHLYEKGKEPKQINNGFLISDIEKKPTLTVEKYESLIKKEQWGKFK